MLGHLVSNGYAASPKAAAREASEPVAIAITHDRATMRQSGWLGRLIAQLLHRR